MPRGRTMSDADLVRYYKMTESGPEETAAYYVQFPDERGKTISDADRARLLELEAAISAQGEGLGRGITRFQRRVERATRDIRSPKIRRKKKGRTMSDADRERLYLDTYIKRNDGGIAKKTRNF
jgi:hypothetical protein